MLLFAVGQQTAAWKALDMLLLLLLIHLPSLQGLETSGGLTEPKVSKFLLAKKTDFPGYHGPFGWDARNLNQSHGVCINDDIN